MLKTRSFSPSIVWNVAEDRQSCPRALPWSRLKFMASRIETNPPSPPIEQRQANILQPVIINQPVITIVPAPAPVSPPPVLILDPGKLRLLPRWSRGPLTHARRKILSFDEREFFGDYRPPKNSASRPLGSSQFLSNAARICSTGQ